MGYCEGESRYSLKVHEAEVRNSGDRSAKDTVTGSQGLVGMTSDGGVTNCREGEKGDEEGESEILVESVEPEDEVL